jgi:transketolase
VEGTDVTLFACGHLVWEALEAAAALSESGISAEVINIHTIKPLDNEAVIRSVQKTGAVVSCEEHQMNGGLGDSIAQLLGLTLPAPMEMVAVRDSFGESGKPSDLLKKYGLSADAIKSAATRVLERKNAR